MREEAGGGRGGRPGGVPRGDLPARGPLSDDQQDRQQVRGDVAELLHDSGGKAEDNNKILSWSVKVREIQRLELSSLKEQYRTKMDYSRCGASLEIEDGSGEAGALQTNDDTYTANMTSGVIDDYYDRELSDYNIVIDTKDMSDTEDTQSSGGGNCDQHSCKVELQTTGQTQSLGFFGAITKLLQPLFTLSY